MKNSILFLSLIFLILSCTKKNDVSDIPIQESGDLVGQFTGTMVVNNGNVTNNLSGNARISESGDFSLNLVIGYLSGNAQKNGNSYSLNNLIGFGIFEGSSITSGEINLDTNSIRLSGTYIDNTPIIIDGSIVMTVEELRQIFRDSVSKSTVFFSHNELCFATITLNGITIENLGPHYQDRGVCWYGAYVYGADRMVNNDDSTSRLACTTATIWNQFTEEYWESTVCPHAFFVVDKNTEYSYTATFENGETYTGEFTSADGGAGVPICLSTIDPDCDGGGGGGDPVQEILENTLVIDYTLSNTPETGQIEFTNEDYLCEMFNNNTGLVFGEQWEMGSYLALNTNSGTFQERVYQLGNLPDQMDALIQINPLSDGIQYHLNPTGTIEVTFLDIYPDYGGEVHLNLSNVRLENASGDYYITVSGSLNAIWE